MELVLKRVSCDKTCGFLIQSSDKREIIEFVKMHFRKIHQMILTDNDIEEKIRIAD